MIRSGYKESFEYRDRHVVMELLDNDRGTRVAVSIDGIMPFEVSVRGPSARERLPLGSSEYDREAAIESAFETASERARARIDRRVKA